MNARIERLNELLKQSPADAFIRFALAKEMEKAGRQNEAIEMLRELLRDDPAYIGAYYHLGALLQHKGRLEEATAVYGNGISMAASLNEDHAKRELQAALANLDSD